MFREFLRIASAVAVVAVGLSGPALADGRGPVVVELFTSQGCSSCPPADAFLGELAGRPDVLALAFHVDYWDYIGWKDPFASREWTERQQAYKRTLRRHMVYTPQMVIDGRTDAVGSSRADVNRAIAEAAMRTDRTPIAIVPTGADRYRVSLPAVKLDPAAEPATLWLVVFDRKHVTPVKRGENAGATLTNHDVVRELRRIGEWSGAATELPLDLAGIATAGRGCAVVLQAGAAGPILGAARIPMGG